MSAIIGRAATIIRAIYLRFGSSAVAARLMADHVRNQSAIEKEVAIMFAASRCGDGKDSSSRSASALASADLLCANAESVLAAIYSRDDAHSMACKCNSLEAAIRVYATRRTLAFVVRNRYERREDGNAV